MKRIAVYPGTFDPVTLGHMDVIRKSAAIFDEVVVGILRNSQKKPLFSEAERLMMIEEAVAMASLTNVRVKCSSGLTVRFAQKEGAIAIIRGFRMATESEVELGISFNNQKFDPGIIFVLIPSDQKHLHVSSSAVRECLAYGELDVLDQYVPPSILKYVTRKK